MFQSLCPLEPANAMGESGDGVAEQARQDRKEKKSAAGVDILEPPGDIEPVLHCFEAGEIGLGQRRLEGLKPRSTDCPQNMALDFDGLLAGAYQRNRKQCHREGHEPARVGRGWTGDELALRLCQKE